MGGVDRSTPEASGKSDAKNRNVDKSADCLEHGNNGSPESMAEVQKYVKTLHDSTSESDYRQFIDKVVNRVDNDARSGLVANGSLPDLAINLNSSDREVDLQGSKSDTAAQVRDHSGADGKITKFEKNVDGHQVSLMGPPGVSANGDDLQRHPPDVQADPATGKIESYSTAAAVKVTLGDDGKPIAYGSNGFSFEYHKGTNAWYYHEDSGGAYVQIDVPAVDSDGRIHTMEHGGLNNGRLHSLDGNGQATGHSPLEHLPTEIVANADPTGLPVGLLLETAAKVIPNETARKDLLWLDHQQAMLNKGIVTGAVFNPVNGVSQLADKALGWHIPALKFDNQNDVNNSVAGNIGKVEGTMVNFIGVGAVMAPMDAALGVSGMAAGALNGGIIGGLWGGVFTPSNPKSRHFWQERGEKALLGASSGSLGGAGGSELNAIGSKLGDSLGADAFKFGAPAVWRFAMGELRAEANSLLVTGKPASAKTLEQAGIRSAENIISSTLLKCLRTLPVADSSDSLDPNGVAY
jgi:hypothetical protein